MALSDLAVFNEQLYSTTTEILEQQVELFNSASRGTLVLSERPFRGDFSETAMFAKVQGLVRRRNPYATGAVPLKHLAHILETMVKIGAGTPPLDVSPAQFRWIQENPEIAAATYAKQLAQDTLADMLGVTIGALRAAIVNEGPDVTHDISADVDNNKLSHIAMNDGVRRFGDAGNQILAWLMHSSPLYDLYGNGLQNNESLFSYGTVNIASDPFGRVFVISDCPDFVTGSGATTKYHTLGLTSSAGVINMNDDFDSNTETKNGDENIQRTIQSEWSYNLGLKGYSWDKTNGGKAPTDAALKTGSNWDRYATDIKSTAGVVVIHK